MNPEFGSRLKDLVFEQNDEVLKGLIRHHVIDVTFLTFKIAESLTACDPVICTRTVIRKADNQTGAAFHGEMNGTAGLDQSAMTTIYTGEAFGSISQNTNLDSLAHTIRSSGTEDIDAAGWIDDGQGFQLLVEQQSVWGKVNTEAMLRQLLHLS
jgi:hypothetical protein